MHPRLPARILCGLALALLPSLSALDAQGFEVNVISDLRM